MIIEITRGVKIYQNDNISILFGIPPEVIKFIMKKNIPFPEYLVIPDTVIRYGINQNATEFPLYYYLFVLGHFFKGRKLSIIGNEDEIQRNRELLRLTLLGPTREEYQKIGNNTYFEELYQESRAISVKDKDGNEIPIDGFINFHSFQENRAVLDGTVIHHKGPNVYEVNGELIDINFDEPQLAPYRINTDFVPQIPHKFGIDILGGGSGFTPYKPSSAVLLNYHSDYMMIDCMAFLDQNLKSRGISKRQIKSLFLTHIHDDHCNIFPLVEFNDKIDFLATKEIYWMAMKKLSLTTGVDLEEFYSYFNFIELEPYKKTPYYGITIQPHYTVHSIPTIGATFRLNDRGKNYSIAFGGDNKSMPDILKMTESGIVNRKKAEYLKNLYQENHHLFFADGGMGILHGDPEDTLNSASDRIIFLHLEKLPEKFDAVFSMAVAGKRYTLIENKNDSYQIRAMQFLEKQFPGISPSWSTALMSSINIVNCNMGDVVFRQGESRKGTIFLILSGSCTIFYHDGTRLNQVAVKEVGDFIGEMAVINHEKSRSASVIATTPVTLCEIPDDLFYSFIRDENRIRPIKTMWRNRKLIEGHYPFNQFADNINESIAKVSELIELEAGEIITNSNSQKQWFYILIEGKISVLLDRKEISRITKKGCFFGHIENKTFQNLINRSEYKVIQKTTLLRIPDKEIVQIIRSTPIFNYSVFNTLKEIYGNPVE